MVTALEHARACRRFSRQHLDYSERHASETTAINAAASALLDPRSVDGYSPLIYAERGFTLDKTGAMLYRLIGL